MSDACEISVSVVRDAGIVVVRATGACRATVCPSLRAYFEWMRKPVVQDVYLDLSAAGYVDSTFIGFLVGSSQACRKDGRPDLHLVAPSPAVLKALDQMHLAAHFRVADEIPTMVGTVEQLPRIDASNVEMADLIVKAHEALIAADPRNEPEFRRVVDGFKAIRDKSKPDA
jgi:anti-anti-sigma factor